MNDTNLAKKIMASLLPTPINHTKPPTFHDGEEKLPPNKNYEKANNSFILSYARDEWIQRKLIERESEYLEFRNLQIFCGTFNANGKSPTSIDISKWLCGGEPDSSAMKDCYVCSFQEIVDLNAANVIAEGHSAKRATQWANMILQTLNRMAPVETNGSGSRSSSSGGSSRNGLGGLGGSFDSNKDDWSGRGGSNNGGGEMKNGDSNNSNSNENEEDHPRNTGAYRLIATKYLVGIAIVAFIKAEHVNNVGDVQVQTAGVGIGGFVGNKGAAALRFTYGNSSICVVSSHLSAHRGAVGSRNSDYNNILNKVQFKDRHTDGNNSSSSISILDHDYVFWLGDLNYRIQVDISTEECYHRIRTNKKTEKGKADLVWLRSQDQLNIERAHGRVFELFDEGVLNFLPTYKYIPGEDVYDDRPEKKMRAPAWCDRILWYCRMGNNSENSGGSGIKLIKQIKYQRENSIKISDHKPVYGTFDVQVKMIVKKEQKRVYNELMRALDAWENESIPKVSIDCNNLYFDQLEYKTRQKKTITITNIGKVGATFRFVPKLEDDYICKNWLSITPTFSMLLPDESIQVHVEANINSDVANGLQYQQNVLDDILVVRLENGRDYFITISGIHVTSCYGSSIEQLYNNTNKQHVENGGGGGGGGGGNGGGGKSSHIPSEIWRLINALYTKSTTSPTSTCSGMDTEGLFIESGDRSDISLIRHSLDSQNRISSNVSSHSLAEALLELLESLADTIVPSTFYGSLCTLNAVSTSNKQLQQWSTRFLTQLPTINHNIFIYLIGFLKELLSHSNLNQLNVEILSSVFSSSFIRSSYVAQITNDKIIVEARKGMKIVIKYFLRGSGEE